MSNMLPLVPFVSASARVLGVGGWGPGDADEPRFLTAGQGLGLDVWSQPQPFYSFAHEREPGRHPLSLSELSSELGEQDSCSLWGIYGCVCE